MRSIFSIVVALVMSFLVGGLTIDVQNASSIAEIATVITKGLYVYHNPLSGTGDFNQPQSWYWWLSGNGWEAILNYIVYTDDTAYEADLLSALSKNVGPAYDFVLPSQVNSEANDDQMYWVYNALTALEYNFTALPCVDLESGGCANSWLTISVNAFELFASRWQADSTTCGGGLKWQYDPNANGYDYKNAVTNGGFFQTAARLARYTGNQTFTDWATKIWDWSTGIGIISADYHVFDGTWDGDGANCSNVSGDEWSYNVASYLHGAAHMYTLSEGALKESWESRVQGLVAASNSTFFGPTTNSTLIMYEQKCELTSSCGTDQTSFKGSLARWLGKTAMLVPSVRAGIMGLLEASAQGAAASCNGYGNSTCGLKWYVGDFDGISDFGAVLSALEVVQSLLVTTAPSLAVIS